MTGNRGFIGSHLCAELRSCGYQVRGYDIKNGQNCHRRWQLNEALDAIQPDAVIHLAAKVGRLFGEDDVQATIADNAGMTANVAQACGERGIRLVYASTSEVYGDWGDEYVSEDDPFTRIPHNVYGLSKRWGEEVCKLYAPHRLTVLRFSMPYGPGLPAGRGRAALVNFLYSALHLEPITVHRGAERSWCWIGDTCRGARLVLERTDGGAYNVGRDDNALSMRAVAEMCCDYFGSPYDLIREIDAPQRQTVVKRLGTSKLRDLGWEPHVDLEEGIARTAEAVKAQYPLPVAA